MRRTTVIPVAIAIAFASTVSAAAVAGVTAASPDAPQASVVLVDSESLEAQMAAESSSLSAVAVERTTAELAADKAAGLADEIQTERGLLATRTTRTNERIALEAAAAAKAAADAAAAKAAAAAAAAAEAARIAAMSPRELGQLMAAQRGWTGSQWTCLNSLWTRESNWNPSADNPSSSAYGIPQALPGSKMSSAGADWATNPATQIEWGLGYIAGSYGTPCGAWAHSQSHNWY